jgi:hypothetical protein
VTIDADIERLYDLNPGTTPLEEGSPHERPHKPLLLLAALDLIDQDLAAPDLIPWCQELRARFTLKRYHSAKTVWRIISPRQRYRKFQSYTPVAP